MYSVCSYVMCGYSCMFVCAAFAVMLSVAIAVCLCAACAVMLCVAIAVCLCVQRVQ